MTEQLAIDRTVHSALGDTVVADLRSRLVPIDCQTCGARLDDSAVPTMAVDVLGSKAFAALHHEACRPSDWRKVAETLRTGPHLTWRAGSFVMPGIDLAMILVNPTCEGAQLTQRGMLRKSWHVTDLDRFTNGGFHSGPIPVPPPAPPQGLEVVLKADRVAAMSVTDPLKLSWNAEISEEFLATARKRSVVIVGVTTKIDPPNSNITVPELTRLMDAGDVAYAISNVTWFDRPVQRLSEDTDLTEEKTLDNLAAAGQLVKQAQGVELTRDHFSAVAELLSGADHGFAKGLAHRDKMIAVLMLAVTYRSQRGSVHVMTPDESTARDYETAYRQILKPVQTTVERVGTGRPAAGRTIVVGSQDEFTKAWARPSFPVGDILAVVVGGGSDYLAQSFLRRYTRLAEA
jgi:hypothetical protein